MPFPAQPPHYPPRAHRKECYDRKSFEWREDMKQLSIIRFLPEPTVPPEGHGKKNMSPANPLAGTLHSLVGGLSSEFGI